MDKGTLTQDSILHTLKEQANVLHERFHVKRIGLFGSFAKNESDNESDIDFLVDFEEGNLDYYTIRRDLHDFLSRKFKRKVDIAIVKSLKPLFRDSILKQAIYA